MAEYQSGCVRMEGSADTQAFDQILTQKVKTGRQCVQENRDDFEDENLCRTVKTSDDCNHHQIPFSSDYLPLCNAWTSLVAPISAGIKITRKV